MKKVLSLITILSFFLSGCLKDETINTKGNLIDRGRLIEIPYSGLEYFSQKSVLTAGVTDPIVLPIVINVAAANAKTVDKDLTVTIAYDDAVRVAYNSVPDNVVEFEAMPDSCYSLSKKTAVIKAGQYLDTSSLKITFYPEKIDPTKNYMAAISIKDAQGETISGNFSTAYFHTIGNPLAGNYMWDFSRWNRATATGALSGASFTGEVTTFLPVDPTTIIVQTGYYTQPHYVLSFVNTGGVLSDFSVSFKADELASLFTANGITIVDAPKLLIADGVAKHFKIQYLAFNGTANRYIIDDFYK